MKYTVKHPEVEAFEVNDETSQMGASIPASFNGVISWGAQGIYIIGYIINSLHPKVSLGKGMWVIKNLTSGKFTVMTGKKFRETYRPSDSQTTQPPLIK